MLMTKLKTYEEISSCADVFFVIICTGCSEIRFPEEEARALIERLKAEGRVAGSMTMDYLCDPVFLKQRIFPYSGEIGEADAILVLSCGVGVQTAADFFPDIPVYTACDTVRLPGFQGVTPLEVDCGRCGECYLNLTGGICPITACHKSLVNGPCGGTKHGMCEVDPTVECGWERIYRRLEASGRLDLMTGPVKIRNYAD